MIVDVSKVETALEYLNDSEIAAKVRFDATTAENAAKEIFARLFLGCEAGSVAQREAMATVNPEYQQAKKTEARAIAELERHKANIKSADMICEIWRTENANARAAERYAR